jgi:hypothetical protein
MGLHADRVDARVGTSPARHLAQLLEGRCPSGVVDRLRPDLVPRERQALGQAVDRDDPARAHEQPRCAAP